MTATQSRSIFARAFWTRWRMVAALAAAALVVAFVFVPHRAGRITFTTAKVTRGTLTVTVSATGTLAPLDQVDVGTEVSGRVDKVLVDYNDHVKAGELLAIINTDTQKSQLAQYQATLGQARATLATNEATLAQTKEKSDSYNELQKQNAVAILDVQSAEADYARAVASIAQAKATMQSAEAQIESTEATIDKAQIRAPIDGVVLNRAVSTGQTVAASFTTPVMFTLASDLSVMQLTVNIDEADIGAVHVGQIATFIVDAFPNHNFTAKLVALYNSPTTTNGVVTYPGILMVDNREGLLRPGLTASADILVASVRNATLVPNGSLRFTPPVAAVKTPPPMPTVPNGEQGGRVWVLKNNRPEPRDLILGETDGRLTQILSGNLAPGEAAITDIATGPVPGGAQP